MDKQAAKLLGKEWKSVSYLRLISEKMPEELISKDKILEKNDISR